MGRPRTTLLATLVAAMLSPEGTAQEVRVNQYGASSERLAGVGAWPLGITYVWGQEDGFCSSWEAARRSMDLRGGFTTVDEPVFASCTSHVSPAVAMASSGELLVVATGDDSDRSGIWARIFDGTGAPLTSDFLVNQVETGFQGQGDVCYLESGRFAVAWSDPGAGAFVGRIVMLDGTMPDAARTLTVASSSAGPKIAPRRGGGIIGAWAKVTVGPFADPHVRLFDDTLSPLSAEIAVSQGACQTFVTVAASTSSGFLVAWECEATPYMDVMARALDAGGTPVGSELPVSTYTGGGVAFPYAIAFDQRDVGVVVWHSQFQDGDAVGVFARRFDAACRPLDAREFQVNGTTDYDQEGARMAMLASGDFVIGWSSSQDASGGAASSYARRFFFPYSVVVAPGPGSGNAPTVLVSSPDGLETSALIPAYGTTGYGANVGAGDVDGALAEALTGPGPSPVFGPQVRAFRAAGAAISKINFYAYGTLRYGVRPAGGDVEGDGRAEILTAPGAGAVFGPHVRGWDYDGGPLSPITKINFYAYQTLRWGASVAGGDIDGDGMQEMLTGPGPGPTFGPVVHGYDYDGLQVTALAKVSFLAFSSGTHGATVAAADVESDGYGLYGDGFQEIVVGRGPDPSVGADARLFDFDAATLAQKYEVTAFGYAFGTSVAGGDVDAGDTEEIVTAPGADPSATADVVAWEWDPKTGNGNAARLQAIGPDRFTAFGGQTAFGASVAVGSFE